MKNWLRAQPDQPATPEYLDSRDTGGNYDNISEAGALATEAAADFLRAVCVVRWNRTVEPSRRLADYLRGNPHELHGDDDLPVYVEAAGGAGRILVA